MGFLEKGEELIIPVPVIFSQQVSERQHFLSRGECMCELVDNTKPRMNTSNVTGDWEVQGQVGECSEGSHARIEVSKIHILMGEVVLFLG